MEMSGQSHALAALSSANDPRYPLDDRLGGPKAGIDSVKRKSLTPAGNRSADIQPLPRCYTD
jgi:hypothetical protein